MAASRRDVFSVAPAPGAEIERLTQLAERIHTQMKELQTTDESRRELLANVSHDLRTAAYNAAGAPSKPCQSRWISRLPNAVPSRNPAAAFANG